MSIVTRTVVIGGLVSILFMFLSNDIGAASFTAGAPDPFKSQQQDGGDAKIRPQPQQAQRPPSSLVQDVMKHRGGTPSPFTRSYDELVLLDLNKVDYDADVLAEVNGIKITRDEFRNNAIMFVGALEINRFVTAILAEIGREKRIAEGADPAAFVINDKLVEEEVLSQFKMQQQQGQMSSEVTIEEFKEGIDSTYGWERYCDMIEAILAFGLVYIPDPEPKSEADQEAAEEGGEKELDPNLPIGVNNEGEKVNINIPMLTWNAMGHSEQDLRSRDTINTMYGSGQPMSGMLKPQFVRLVKESLLRTLDVEYFYSDSLKPGLFLRIEDKELPLDDIYSVMYDKISQQDKQLTLREILLMKSLDSALLDAGFYLTDDELEAAFKAHQGDYAGTIFPLEFMIQLYGYFNMDRYKNIYRRRAGFEKMIADQMKDDKELKEGEVSKEDSVLKAFYEGPAKLFYENGSVKIQVIFAGIFDQAEKKYRENGYAWALERIQNALAEIEGGKEFDEVAKKFEGEGGIFTTYDFNLLNRRELRMTLNDSSKSALLSGYSLSDYIFYRSVPGEIIGPVVKEWSDLGNPSRKGVYLVNVVDFFASQKITPYEQRKEMVKIDYLDQKFIYWAQEALKEADIKLTLKN